MQAEACGLAGVVWYPYAGMKLRVSDLFSVHHQESSTVYTAIGICHTGYADWASCQHNLYVLLCVQCYDPNDGQKTCPKHVQFYSKNKFEKLVHLVGFIIRIYHDVRSSECQNSILNLLLIILLITYIINT